jgi:hypothetical protein
VNGFAASLGRRADSLSRRIDGLAGLERVVALPPEQDIAAPRWRAINSLFGGIHAQLDARLKSARRNLLAEAHRPAAARQLNSEMGAIELELSRVYSAFDLYADVLTQRHAPQLGALLAVIIPPCAQFNCRWSIVIAALARRSSAKACRSPANMAMRCR